MYYVVYLKVPRRNVVNPYTWVYNCEKQMNKDMFHGVNPSQKVLCYYSPTAYNEIGVPGNIVLNFNLPINGEFPNEGCYNGKIKVFKGNGLKQNVH